MSDVIFIFTTIFVAMIAMAFWESSVEGRNAWHKGKKGWQIKITKNLVLSRYHLFLFLIMLPLIIFVLPIGIYGWDSRLFGILFSAYTLGLIIEDFLWYVFNPVVELREFWSKFSDYYPWIKIKKRKIIPVGYIILILLSITSWYFLWR